MNTISEGLTILIGTLLLSAIGFEISRRRRHLRELYNVLNAETRHITAQLEAMVEQGVLQPYTGDAAE